MQSQSRWSLILIAALFGSLPLPVLSATAANPVCPVEVVLYNQGNGSGHALPSRCKSRAVPPEKALYVICPLSATCFRQIEEEVNRIVKILEAPVAMGRRVRA